MAVVKIPYDNVTFTDTRDVQTFLAARGIEYEQWTPSRALAPEASAEDVLDAYDHQITMLKARGGYVTADVIDVKAETPNLDAMLARFSREHWHDEDEVRFIIDGRGIFHINADRLRASGASASQDRPSADGATASQGGVFVLEVGAGDLIRVPRGTHHWFDLCAERRIRAIRLFQDPSGWTPHYTESGIDRGFQPLCFGPTYIGPMVQPPA